MRTLHIARAQWLQDFAQSIHRPLTEADHAELDPLTVLTADWTEDVVHLVEGTGFCKTCRTIIKEAQLEGSIR